MLIRTNFRISFSAMRGSGFTPSDTMSREYTMAYFAGKGPLTESPMSRDLRGVVDSASSPSPPQSDHRLWAPESLAKRTTKG